MNQYIDRQSLATVGPRSEITAKDRPANKNRNICRQILGHCWTKIRNTGPRQPAWIGMGPILTHYCVLTGFWDRKSGYQGRKECFVACYGNPIVANYFLDIKFAYQEKKKKRMFCCMLWQSYHCQSLLRYKIWMSGERECVVACYGNPAVARDFITSEI